MRVDGGYSRLGLKVYVIRRLILVVPVLVGVTLLIFAITQMFDPISRAVIYVNPEKVRDWDSVVETYGLNDPVHVQYFRWMSQVLQGNLGYSQECRLPVVEGLLRKLPATAELVLYSAPFIIIIGIYLGVKSAVHKDKAVDHLTRILAIVGWSLPTFWSAIILLSIFYGIFHIFPPGRLGYTAQHFVMDGVRSGTYRMYTGLNSVDGLLNGELWVTWDALQHLVLPCANLVIIQIALIIRVMRSSMLESLSKAYIVTAKAKGLSNKEVINKHARRNALIPVVTLSALVVAGMLTGVVITETVFNIPGIGSAAARAAVYHDTPFVLGFAMFAAIVFVFTNLLVDVIYAYIDPRIRLG